MPKALQKQKSEPRLKRLRHIKRPSNEAAELIHETNKTQNIVEEKKNEYEEILQVHQEIEKIWSRPIWEQPTNRDLPRLARGLKIYHTLGNELIFEGREDVDEYKLTTGFITTISEFIFKDDAKSVLKKFSAYTKEEGDISADLERLFQEERKILQKKGSKKKKEALYFCQGPLSRLLSALQQDIIYPVMMRFRNKFYQQYPFKDARGSWMIRILIRDDEGISLTHTKKEQSHSFNESEYFEFNWELTLHFTQDFSSFISEHYIIDDKYGEDAKPLQDILSQFYHPKKAFLSSIGKELRPRINEELMVKIAQNFYYIDSQNKNLKNVPNPTPAQALIFFIKVTLFYFDTATFERFEEYLSTGRSSPTSPSIDPLSTITFDETSDDSLLPVTSIYSPSPDLDNSSDFENNNYSNNNENFLDNNNNELNTNNISNNDNNNTIENNIVNNDCSKITINGNDNISNKKENNIPTNDDIKKEFNKEMEERIEKERRCTFSMTYEETKSKQRCEPISLENIISFLHENMNDKSASLYSIFGYYFLHPTVYTLLGLSPDFTIATLVKESFWLFTLSPNRNPTLSIQNAINCFPTFELNWKLEVNYLPNTEGALEVDYVAYTMVNLTKKEEKVVEQRASGKDSKKEKEKEKEREKEKDKEKERDSHREGGSKPKKFIRSFFGSDKKKSLTEAMINVTPALQVESAPPTPTINFSLTATSSSEMDTVETPKKKCRSPTLTQSLDHSPLVITKCSSHSSSLVDLQLRKAKSLAHGDLSRDMF